MFMLEQRVFGLEQREIEKEGLYQIKTERLLHLTVSKPSRMRRLEVSDALRRLCAIGQIKILSLTLAGLTRRVMIIASTESSSMLFWRRACAAKICLALPKFDLAGRRTAGVCWSHDVKARPKKRSPAPARLYDDSATAARRCRDQQAPPPGHSVYINIRLGPKDVAPVAANVLTFRRRDNELSHDAHASGPPPIAG